MHCVMSWRTATRTASAKIMHESWLLKRTLTGSISNSDH